MFLYDLTYEYHEKEELINNLCGIFNLITTNILFYLIVIKIFELIKISPKSIFRLQFLIQNLILLIKKNLFIFSNTNINNFFSYKF